MSWQDEIINQKSFDEEFRQSGDDFNQDPVILPARRSHCAYLTPRRAAPGPLAVSARYDRQLGQIIIRLNTGVDISFLPGNEQSLEGASDSELDVIEIFPSGLGIHFPKLDADLYLLPLLQPFIVFERGAPRHNGYRGGLTGSSPAR